MKATQWEFANRALLFGLIYAVTFGAYSVDQENATALLANWSGARMAISADAVAHGIFALAALLAVLAALVRTWASSYLGAGVVYASEVRTASLVADGPYRRVRNPLYFANIMLALAMGALASRTGFVIAVTLTLIFCYRLILREEADLRATQGEPYEDYCQAVPRLWPAWRPRIPSAGRPPNWVHGFKAEFWYWGIAVSLVVFAVTLNVKLFFAILAGSLIWFWIASTFLEKGRP
jgi:protein-S-isoprenylcysteine O-methyltransferase Ste14